MTTMVYDLVCEKHGRTFDILDANKDGILEWSDYQALTARFLSAYDIGMDDRRAQALHAFFQMEWVELLRHAGVTDGGLKRAQYIMAAQLLSIDTSRINLADGAGHVIFDVIDTDRDNQITKGEFTVYLKKVWQVTEPGAVDCFDRMDTDGDGAIDRMEFVRAIREQLLSNDADAPGSLIFGTL
ncbi:EF-hand domain-containing protein [Streptomyces sp. NPDC090303]|uniref:EF-hand domain-containing protein n=1 Tax=Streptomyces sp. NPDC090303 TaxID=3365960 RepID=UPI00382C3421